MWVNSIDIYLVSIWDAVAGARHEINIQIVDTHAIKPRPFYHNPKDLNMEYQETMDKNENSSFEFTQKPHK